MKTAGWQPRQLLLQLHHNPTQRLDITLQARDIHRLRGTTALKLFAPFIQSISPSNPGATLDAMSQLRQRGCIVTHSFQALQILAIAAAQIAQQGLERSLVAVDQTLQVVVVEHGLL